jgi:hypothetical protein
MLTEYDRDDWGRAQFVAGSSASAGSARDYDAYGQNHGYINTKIRAFV